MRVEGAFFAEKVTERPDGRLDVEGFGPFVLSVAELPFTLSRYVVPILLFFTPQDRERRIALDFTLLGPANTSLMKEQIIVASPYPRHRAIIAVTLNDVLLAEAGVYRIRFEVGAQKYDGPSFDVEMLTDEEADSDQ
ncbi:MAG TPA: hypothetical protein VIG44_11600 [Thermomicrobiales bacterium]|jgi:hypothetical protein